MRSGLFWKLLLAFWLTFFAITQGVWVLLAVLNSQPLNERVLAERVAPALLDHLESALKSDGLEAALRARSSFFIDDQKRLEIVSIGDDVPVFDTTIGNPAVQRDVVAADGHRYRLLYRYSTATALGPFRVPRELLILGILGGPVFGALVAWYLITPIRRLQRGFTQIANGNLQVRIAPKAGGRHDELANLLLDFDVMAERLEQSIYARDRLLHDVSHELRSPLSRLQLAIGLAQQDPARALLSMERIKYEGRRLDSVIHELLTLARTENGLPIGDGYFDLAGVLDNVISDARFEADATTVKIAYTICSPLPPEDCPSLIGSAELVRWALENVIRNAIRFSAPNQIVEIRLTYDSALQRYEVDVTDQGRGAPENVLSSIFEPFVRGEEASQGFGLGLAIAKRAVLAHGGTIEARNRPESGLGVKILLPVARNAQEPCRQAIEPRRSLAEPLGPAPFSVVQESMRPL